jgi:hypothetical protein
MMGMSGSIAMPLAAPYRLHVGRLESHFAEKGMRGSVAMLAASAASSESRRIGIRTWLGRFSSE